MRKVMTVLAAALVSVWVVGEGSARAQDSARSGKRSAVSYRLASTTTVQGFERMNLGREAAIYVAPKAVLSGSDIASVRTIDVRNGTDLALSLTGDAATRFGNLLSRHVADQLAIFSGKRLVAAGAVSFDGDEGLATISGLSSSQVQRLAGVLRIQGVVPAGAVIALVPAQRVIQAGEATTIDVFVSRVSDLRSYQVSLTTSGGASGQLAIEDLSIDTDRADFVFGDRDKLKAADRVGKRIGAVLVDGGVDVAGQAYLGTYVVRASGDATGTFSINVRTDDQSLLWDSSNKPIRFGTSTPATISVGTARGGSKGQ